MNAVRRWWPRPDRPKAARVTSVASHADEQGLSALELSLVMPLFCLIIFGTLDFGQAILRYNLTSAAARDGARQGQMVVPHGQGSVTPAEPAAITTAALVTTGGLQNQFTVSATTGNDATNGDWVMVQVDSSYTPVAGRLLRIGTVPVRAYSKLYLP